MRGARAALQRTRRTARSRRSRCSCNAVDAGPAHRPGCRPRCPCPCRWPLWPRTTGPHSLVSPRLNSPSAMPRDRTSSVRRRDFSKQPSAAACGRWCWTGPLLDRSADPSGFGGGGASTARRPALRRGHRRPGRSLSPRLSGADPHRGAPATRCRPLRPRRPPRHCPAPGRSVRRPSTALVPASGHDLPSASTCHARPPVHDRPPATRMTALNEEILPVVWSLARRELLVRPGPTFDELVDRLTPTGLLKRERAQREDRRPASRHVRPSLTALVNSGAVVRDGDRLQLVDTAEDEQAFRLRVLRGMLHTDRGLRRQRRSGLHTQAEAAFAWLHLQGLGDPVPGSWNDAQAALQARVRGNATDWLNDVAFNTLERWARWFGWVRRARPGAGGRPVARPHAPRPGAPARNSGIGGPARPRILSSRWPSDCRGYRTGRWDGRWPRLWPMSPTRSVDEGRVPEGLSLTLQRLHLEKAAAPRPRRRRARPHAALGVRAPGSRVRAQVAPA